MPVTQFIALEKRPYQESAYLLYGVSPDFGRLSLIAYGAQKNHSPVDIYREFEVEFTDSGKSTLHSAGGFTVLRDFTGVSEVTAHYRMAAKIGAFLLKNLPEEMPQPYTYDTSVSVWTQLAQPDDRMAWSLEQSAVIIKTVYLYENGLLPEPADEAQAAFLEHLVGAGIEGNPLPERRTEFWHQFNLWLNKILDFHHLEH